ncbi:hypothetical protein [Actinoplanes subglobosus]|uniref:Response regulator n=1 Tax=Actinoplanes subglobosus TaxID=1547892 RepID=A0ABV8IPM5_9ACTN
MTTSVEPQELNVLVVDDDDADAFESTVHQISSFYGETARLPHG